MNALTVLAVCLAGGAGAAARLVLDGLIRTRVRATYPVATIVINVTGSLLLGLMAGLAAGQLLPHSVHLIAGTGLLGGYTTFSTASFETVRLLQEGRVLAGVLYGLGSLVVTTAVAGLGLVIGLSL